MAIIQKFPKNDFSPTRQPTMPLTVMKFSPLPKVIKIFAISDIIDQIAKNNVKFEKLDSLAYRPRSG
ncbi:MAG: hypothetical protein U9Q77_01205 [Candidatus Marinimicrobia bacterium]|nr:hypothetical protein [Candidatus Neomarinimicrobiota bacterium]